MRALIVGAGLQGISTAYYLAEQGAEVTVLERRSDLALEASGGNGGYLQAECPEVWNAPGILPALLAAWRAGLGRARHASPMVVDSKAMLGLVPWGLRFLRNSRTHTYQRHTAINRDLAQYSLQSMAQLRAHHNIEYSHAPYGALFIFREANGIEGYRPLIEYLRERGAQIDIKARDALIAEEPSLAPIAGELVGAISFPRDESGDPAAFCRALAALARSRGVKFKFSTEAHSLKSMARDADALVIAAGVASKALAAELDIHLPIAPAKGYSLTIPFREFSPRLKHVIADMDVHAGLNPMGQALRVAGTAEFTAQDAGISPQRVAYLLRLVEATLPEFAKVIDRSKVSPFAGFRPLSADGLPMIGRSKHPKIYINTGHGGLGWTQAVGSARALADQIMGQAPQIDLAPFSPRRF